MKLNTVLKIRGKFYYPFGMTMLDRRYSVGIIYRYGFNGKENDNEVKDIEGSQQDYGMRIYDPRIGKFLSVDPLSNDFPWFTPYQFSGDQPINSIDLDGMEDHAVFNKPFFGFTLTLSLKTISRTVSIPSAFNAADDRKITVKNNTLNYRFSAFGAFPLGNGRDILGVNIHNNDARELTANASFSTMAKYKYNSTDNQVNLQIFETHFDFKLNLPIKDIENTKDHSPKTQMLTGIVGYNISTGKVGIGFNTSDYSEGFIKIKTPAEVAKGLGKDYTPLDNMDFGTLEPELKFKIKVKNVKVEMPFKVGTGMGKLPLWGLYPFKEQKKLYKDPVTTFMSTKILFLDGKKIISLVMDQLKKMAEHK